MKAVLFGLILTLVCALAGFWLGRGARSEGRRREDPAQAAAKPEPAPKGEAPPPPAELPKDSRPADSVPKGLE